MRFDRQWLELPDSVFAVKVTDWFNLMAKPAIRGGYKESTRKEHVKQAIDMTADFARYREGEYRDMGTSAFARNTKYNAMAKAHMTVFKTMMPPPSPSISDMTKARTLLAEKQVMLEKKLELLAIWGDTAKSEGFLQGDKYDVQFSLKQLYKDAEQKAAYTPDKWSYATWTGMRMEKSGSVVNEKWKKAVSGELSAEAGAKASGQVEVEWKSMRGTAKFEAFAGARGSMSGSASASRTELSASADMSAEIGFRLTASAQVETDYVVVGGELDAFAGAMARGSASIKINKDGLAVEASASAFAGIKAKARGFLTIKFKGFEVATIEGTGEVSAGAGAEASFKFESSIFGPSKVEFSASAAVGIGGGGGMGVEYNMNNLRLGTTKFIYEDVRQFYMKRMDQYSADMIVSDQENRMVYDQTVAAMNALLLKVKSEQLIVSSMVDRAFASA